MNTMLLAVLALWSLLLPGPSQVAPAQVRPEQAAYEVGPAGETTVVVLLENARDAYGIDIRAAFDPALVEVVDADPSRSGIQVQPGDLPQPDFVALQDVDPTAGSIRYVVTQINPTPPANGDGVAFTVRLRSRGVAGVTDFRVELVEISSRDGELLPVQWGTATVQVAGGTADAAVQPTGIALLPTTAPQQAASPTPNNSAANPTATSQPAATGAGAPPPAAAPPDATVAPADNPVASPPAPGEPSTPTQPSDQSSSASAETAAATVAPAAPGNAPATAEPASGAAPQVEAAPEVAEPVAQVAAAPDQPVTRDEIVVAPAVIGDGRPSGSASVPLSPEAAAPEDVAPSPWPVVLAVALVLVAGAAVLLARRSHS